MMMCSMWQISLHFAVAGNSLLHFTHHLLFWCLYNKTWLDIVAISGLKILKF